MKLNEFICPRCGHHWFSECAYGTCDACQTFFYLSDGARRVQHNECTNDGSALNLGKTTIRVIQHG